MPKVYNGTKARGRKLRVYLLKLTLVIIAVMAVVACGQTSSVSLPDLVIDSVTYNRAANSHDAYGMPVMSAFPEYEYTITIRNIGSTPASGLLHVSFTQSIQDVLENYYSGSQLVKYAEPAIESGGVFTAKIAGSYISSTGETQNESKKVRFLVNPETEHDETANVDGGIQFTGKYPIIRIEESNYKNNTYMLNLK